MTIAVPRPRPLFKPLAAASILAVLLLAGCASAPLEAQWTDAQLASGNPLRGARVLVVCEAQDLTIRRVCQEQVGAQLVATGAVPVPAPDVPTAGVSGSAQYVEAARAANAKAVFLTAISQDSTVARSGLSVGIGLGGFGGGGLSGGIGISAPIGGPTTATGYAANGSITESSSGRLVWTGRASQAPSSDLNAQVTGLAKAVVAGAAKAGLF